MKRLLLIAVLVPALCFAQEDTSIHYTHITAAPGLSKDSLYNKLNLWVSKAFDPRNKSADDREAGLMVYASRIDCTAKMPPKKEGKDSAMFLAHFTATFTMQVKDEKYRIQVSDIEYIYSYYLSPRKYPLRSSIMPPFGKSTAAQNEWAAAKKGLEVYLNTLIFPALDITILKKDDF